MGQTSKHTTYFEVLDACQEDGCPICTLTQSAISRYLDGLMHEDVNDLDLRKELRWAGGYCNDHAWQLEQLHAAFGTAIMFRDVLQTALRKMQRAGEEAPSFFGPPRERTWRARLGAVTGAGPRDEAGDPHTGCPVCAVRTKQEQVYLLTILDHRGDEQLREAFSASMGLCLVHLQQALDLTDLKAARTWLLQLQQPHMQELIDELSEFIRKHDYRYRQEARGQEGDAWLRAIEMVAGKRGVR